MIKENGQMYTVAIIGAGNIAAGFDSLNTPKILTHAHAVIGSEGFLLRGFFDVDYNKAREAATKWNTKAFKTLDELAGNADVCVCCVPDGFHDYIIEQAAKFEPQIIITEKPLASSYSNAEKIYNSYYNKQPIAVNYSRRFIPEFRMIKEMIKEYGELVKGIAYYGKGTFHNGSHIIDLLQYFFGNVERVCRTGIVQNDFKGDPTCDAILTWGDKDVYLLGVDSRIVTVFEVDLMFEKTRIRIVDGGQRIEVYKKTESMDYKGFFGYDLSKVIEVDYSLSLIHI